MPPWWGGGTGGGAAGGCRAGLGGGKDLDKEMVEVKGLEYPGAVAKAHGNRAGQVSSCCLFSSTTAT